MIGTPFRYAAGRRRCWRIALLALVALCLASIGVGAAGGAIQDDGNLFSPNARTDFTNRSAQIEHDTGKSVVVRTVASLGGKDISAQADAAFASLNINGVLIFASKADQKLSLKVGQTTRQAISTQEEGQIRDQMLASFMKNDFDGGLLNATDRIGRDLRAVFTNTTANRAPANGPVTAPTTAPARSSGIGFGAILVIVILIIAIIAVFGAIFRRNRGGAVGGYPSGGYGGGGYNGGGYVPPAGPIGGYGPPTGGGGGFGSSAAGGAIGGFGGAILGNAVYDHFRDEHDRERGYNDQYPNGYPGENAPYQNPNNDAGRVDDSYQDTGSWGGASGSDAGGGWSGGDSGGDASGSWGGGDSSGGDSSGSWGNTDSSSS